MHAAHSSLCICCKPCCALVAGTVQAGTTAGYKCGIARCSRGAPSTLTSARPFLCMAKPCGKCGLHSNLSVGGLSCSQLTKQCKNSLLLVSSCSCLHKMCGISPSPLHVGTPDNGSANLQPNKARVRLAATGKVSWFVQIPNPWAIANHFHESFKLYLLRYTVN